MTILFTSRIDGNWELGTGLTYLQFLSEPTGKWAPEIMGRCMHSNVLERSPGPVISEISEIAEQTEISEHRRV